MKKKLYFTVVKEEQENDDGVCLTGNKTITVYDMVDNRPKMFALIEGNNEDSSIELIQVYLDDNGYRDDEFKFVLL